jgi:LysR family transcriptional regulator for bpeEF and oprC
MQTYVRVVESGSFSAAARELGIGQSAVSKQIAALEAQVGAELIWRSSRTLSVTEAGKEFYESSIRLLEDFDAAISRVQRGQTAPKGLIQASGAIA